MESTYLLEFKGEKMMYVFDKDGVCSYSVPSKSNNILENFFSEIILEKTKQARSFGAQPDYSHIGIELCREVMGIVEMNTSENILRYLKEFRDKYASMGISLKRKEGILESAYNSKDRMTVEKFRNPK